MIGPPGWLSFCPSRSFFLSRLISLPTSLLSHFSFTGVDTPPRNVMIPFSPPSAIIFWINAGSGHLIGSIRFASGRNIKTSAMTTAWVAQVTIFQLLGESRTVHAPSSMYIPPPPLRRGWRVPASHQLPLLGHIPRPIGVYWLVGAHPCKGMGCCVGPNAHNKVGCLLGETLFRM